MLFRFLLPFGLLVACFGTGFSAEPDAARLEIGFSDKLGPMHIERMALGQGGLSAAPMWTDRVTEVRALHPALIRLFIQEYFDLLPRKGRYHFATLDRSVETILASGAKPLMCICFKPRVLFPAVDQDVVEPVSYRQWDALIYNLVRHFQKRGAGIQYWEIANEPDIGEDGGCPYRFKPESYVRYYAHSAAAIRKADPLARVGGPALANSHSPLLPALLDLCRTNGAPLDFVSWHIYSSDPKAVRGTIDYVKALVGRYPELNPETILDEWNMDLTNPPLDPRFQPCYIAEVLWQMKVAGLDFSCYYHIRDWYVDYDQFAPFMSERGTAFMTRWWNRMPQFDGLFDYQNHVRPSYFAFKLLSRMRGERLALKSSRDAVHGFATFDPQLRMYNLLVWDFSPSACEADLVLKDLPRSLRTRHIQLDAATQSDDENARLRPEPFQRVNAGEQHWQIQLDPWAMHYWSFE